MPEPEDRAASPSTAAEAVAHEVEEYFDARPRDRARKLADSIAHDYSTSATGLVPLNKRRPIGALHRALDDVRRRLLVPVRRHARSMNPGFTLPGDDRRHAARRRDLLRLLRSSAAYLGSRTGQTMSLLTRSIFGVTGSYIVSALVVIGALGWVGFQGGLMVQIWQGLYGWSAVEALTIIFCGVMIFNNLFGFTGHQHVRPVHRHAADHAVGALPRDPRADRSTRVAAQRSPQEHGRAHLLAGRRRRDRVRDVGQRAGRISLRQAQVHSGRYRRSRSRSPSVSCCSRSAAG